MLSVTPADGATAVSTQMTIAVVLTRPLDATALFASTGAFVNDGLSPPAAILAGPTRSLSADGKTLFVRATLKPDSRFQYSLLGARSVTGEMLHPPYTVAFSTGALLPTGAISGVLACPDHSPAGSFVALMRKDPFGSQTLSAIVRRGQFYLSAEKAECAKVVTRNDGVYTVAHVPAGSWYPIAVVDLNRDGELSLFDDAWGVIDADHDLRPDSLVLGEGETRSGMDLLLRRWLVRHTAKEALANQSGLARQWAEDAAPFYLVAREIDNTGRAWEWQAHFHSSSRDSQVSVAAVGMRCGYEQAQRHGEGLQSFPADWVDTPMVMDSALAACPGALTPGEADSVAIELGWSSRHIPLPYATAEPLWGLQLELLWRVYLWGKDGAFQEVLVDPLSGRRVKVFLRATLKAQEAAVAAQEAAGSVLGRPLDLVYVGGDQVGDDGCAWGWCLRYLCRDSLPLDVAVSPYGVRPDTLTLEGLIRWPIPSGWIDSDIAIDAAFRAGGQEFRGRHPEVRVAAELLWLDPLAPLRVATHLASAPKMRPPTELLERWGIGLRPGSALAGEAAAAWRVLFAGQGSKEFLLVLVEPATGRVTQGFASGPRTARLALGPAQTRAQSWGTRTGLAGVLSWADSVDSAGICCAWAFVFSRPGSDSALVLVSGDSMVTATFHAGGMPCPAHLPETWIDSRQALQAAEEAGGREFRREYADARCGAALGRGWLASFPDRAVWTVTYMAPGQAESLEILVDGTSGELLTGVPQHPFAASASHCVLYPAFPNPCNEGVTLRFALAKPQAAALAVYDVNGREVWRWAQKDLSPGLHSVRWSALSTTGTALPSGLYLVRMIAAGTEHWHKVVLCR